MKRGILIALLGIAVAMAASPFAIYRWMYPYGSKGCLFPCMVSALNAYAADHQGSFPFSDAGSYAALSKLYPDIASARELAGLSGDGDVTRSVLARGTPLDPTSTSWVYNQGFTQEDDPRIAILWESRPGFYPNGRRNFFAGRAALLIDGTITNIASVHWNAFLREQDRLARDSKRK